MDIYDQHEQSERVRSWLKDNAGAIITGVVIGLGAIFGYQQWQNYKVREAHTAAELYERTRPAETAPDAAAPAQAPATPAADAARNELRDEHAGSGFAVLATLEQAQLQAEQGDLDGARASLAWVREQAREPALQALAGLRLARLELAAGQAEPALKTLDALPAGSYVALRAELRGDALAALGRIEEARAAYGEAQTAGAADPARLQMKLAEYAAPAAADEGDDA